MKYVELNVFLRIIGVSPTGGLAKQLIRSEQVSLNGEVETKNKKKLFSGDKIIVEGKTFDVLDEHCKKDLPENSILAKTN